MAKLIIFNPDKVYEYDALQFTNFSTIRIDFDYAER